MSIIELGALGEFLGSIGVIATLIYLATDTRLWPRKAHVPPAPVLHSGERIMRCRGAFRSGALVHRAGCSVAASAAANGPSCFHFAEAVDTALDTITTEQEAQR